MDVTAATDDSIIFHFQSLLLLMDAQFLFSVINNMLTELPLMKVNEFVDNLVIAFGERIVPLLKSLLHVEVTQLTSATGLLHHRSVSGKLITSLMQLHGKEYFKTSLAGPLASLCNDSSIDRSESKALQTAIDDSADLMDTIMNCASNCPPEIRQAFKALQDAVDAKFGGGLKVVGHIFFERGWCPAIALPKMFMQEQEISPQITAALQRVSKTYRDLVRGTSETPQVNNFIKQTQSSYIAFLATLAGAGDKSKAVKLKNYDLVAVVSSIIDAFTAHFGPYQNLLERMRNGTPDQKEQRGWFVNTFDLFKDILPQYKPRVKDKVTKQPATKAPSKKELQKKDALIKACKSGDSKEFLNLVVLPECRMYVDAPVEDGSTYTYPVLLAVMSGALPIVKWFVQNNIKLNVSDNNQNTPFNVACKMGSVDMVSCLLSARPSIDVFPVNKEGSSGLHFLLQSLPTADALIIETVERGAGINLINKAGDAVLALAVKHNASIDVISLLIDRGANVQAADSAGRTAFVWAKRNGYDAAASLLLSKGAQVVLDPDAKSAPATNDVLSSEPSQQVSTSITRPWTAEELKTEVLGRTYEFRCNLFHKKPVQMFKVTLNFDNKVKQDIEVPANAKVGSLLRRCQADASLKLPWDDKVQYGVSFNTEVGSSPKEVLMDADAPLWLHNLELSNIELLIKPTSSQQEQQAKRQMYLKFVLLFPPHAPRNVVLAINPFQAPKGLLSSALKEFLPPSLQNEPQRVGLHICIDSNVVYLNENQPISTSNIINWDLIVVKLRDSCELKSLDGSGERANIVIDKSFEIAKVSDIIANWLGIGAEVIEDLPSPLPENYARAVALELNPPLDLTPPPSPATSSSASTSTSLSAIPSINLNGTAPNSNNSTGADSTSNNNNNLSTSGNSILNPSAGIPNPDTAKVDTKDSKSRGFAMAKPSITTQRPSQFFKISKVRDASSSIIPPFLSPQPEKSHSASSLNLAQQTPLAPSPPSPREVRYTKKVSHSLSLSIRNVPMYMPRDQTLRSFNLRAKDVIEFYECVQIYPTKEGPTETNIIVLPPTVVRLHARWVAPDDETVGESVSALRNALISGAEGISSSGTPPIGLSNRTSSVMQMVKPQEYFTRNEAKILVLGEPRVGKTTLVRQLRRVTTISDKSSLKEAIASKVPHTESTSHGVSQSEWEVVSDLQVAYSPELSRSDKSFVGTPVPNSAFKEVDVKYTFHLFELSGDESFTFAHQFLVFPGSIYILLFNLLAPKDDYIATWLEVIQSRAKDSAVIIAGTHLDDSRINKQRVNTILETLAKKFAKYKNILGFTAIGNKNAKATLHFASGILRLAKQKGYVGGTKLPTSILDLNHSMESCLQEALRSWHPPFIAVDHLKSFYERTGMGEKALHDALRYMLNTGKIIYFGLGNNAPLSDLIFLDNLWFPSLLNSITTLKTTPDAVITHNDLYRIWKSPYYPPHLHQLLVDLLVKFEVLHILPSTENRLTSNKYLIPLLLPEEKPAITKDLITPFETQGPQNDRIYEFDSVPPGFFSRMLARLLPGFDCLCCWRYGAVLALKKDKDKDKENVVKEGPDMRALLEFVPTTYRLRLSVRSDKTGKLLRPLVESINVFVNSWFADRVKGIAVVCAHCISNQSYDPYYFELDHCEREAAQGKQYVMCRGVHPVRIDQLAVDVTLANLDQSTVVFNDITMDEKLGEGSFAAVYKGKWKNKTVAVKVINFNEDDAATEKFREFRKEVILMSGLQHTNIVSMRGICLKPFCLITEFMMLGDLHRWLLDPVRPLNWPLRLKIATDIARGMMFLHSSTPPIVHLDLKTPNILLGWTHDFQVIAKVSDFGLSTGAIAEGHAMVGRQVWNLSWLAPEIMKGHSYSSKVDVYSFGIMLWELLTRQVPFDEYKDKYKFEYLLEDEIKKGLRPSIPVDCPAAYTDLFVQCWRDIPEERPSFPQIVQRLAEMAPVVLGACGETTMPDLTDLPRPTESASFFDDQPSPSPSPSPPTSHPRLANTLEPSSPSLSITPPNLLWDINDMSTESDDETDDDYTEEELTNDEVPSESASSRVLVYHGVAGTGSGSIQCMRVITVAGRTQVWGGCGDGSIIIIDAITRKVVATTKVHSDAVYSMISITEKGEPQQIWTASKDGTLVILDIKNVQKPVKIIKVGGAMCTCLLEVGKNVWSGCVDGSIKIYSKKNFKCVKTIKKEGTVIGCLLIPNPDEISFVWAGTEKNILIIDAINFAITTELEGHTGMVHSMRVEPTTNTIWSCSSDKTIRVWNITTGNMMHVLQGHSGRVFCLLPIGNYVVSGSWDSTLFVWDCKTCKFIQQLTGFHKDGIGSLVLLDTNDMCEVWSGSWDKSMCIFRFDNS